MKKRFTAILMALAVGASTCPVFADDFQWEAVVSETNVAVGDVFYLDLDVTSNPGINNASIFVTYNPDVVVPTLSLGAPEDLMTYSSSRAGGTNLPLFSSIYVDGRVDSTDLAGGEIRFADYIAEADENNILKEMSGTGTLLRIYFRAVGDGSADLGFTTLPTICRTPVYDSGNLVYDISMPTVTVGTGTSAGTDTDTDTDTDTSEDTTTAATTESTTETTTSSSSSSSSGSTGSSDSSSSTGSASSATTTTEATTEGATEATTEAATLEAASETTTAAPVAATPAFTDLATHPWAESFINELAASGIINGYPDNTFRPGDNVKRADFIIMLLRAMNVDTTAAPSDNFTDVRSDKYYYNAVGLAKELGIASGNPDGTFNPESNITRQDMMILAKKAVEIQSNTTLTGDISVLDRFADSSSISPYAVESLAAMVSEDIVSGTGDNIQPKDNTTRAQAAVIISKIINIM